MADEPQKKDAQAMIERTCRIVMDVRVRTNRITPEHVASYFTPEEIGEGLTWEWAEQQSRLLSALLKDEESLDQFLAGITRGALELLVDSRQVAGDQADEEEERLFEKVFSKMSDEDALYIREAKRDGVFLENIELLDNAFMIDWREADIEEVRVMEYDINEQESKLCEELSYTLELRSATKGAIQEPQAKRLLTS